ncbi:type IV secretory system conjugative DNA transfer family protein [Nocardia abscessus]|uniref:type IV secretory system conjugative DNA transfer family protein n=1 Tax=Nocardia abscessus TaxID=120957 RepID=UPI00245451EB|nr:type IV secretory system conjugative DNA transfer family protein [Nocardia abscessus]
MTTEQLPLPLGPASLVWQYVLWPSPFKEAVALGLLTNWAAQRHAPQIVLEARSNASGIEYLVGTQLRHAAQVRRSIEQLVAGSAVTSFDTNDRETISTARRLRLTAADWPIQPSDRLASLRSILGALTAVKEHEQLALQLILGPRRQPTLPPPEPLHSRQSVISRVLIGSQHERRPDARAALARKLGQFGFRATLRIGVKAPSAERRKTLLLGLAAAIGTVEGAGVHLQLVKERAGRLNQPQPNWSIFMPAQHLSVPEVSHLVAWPINEHDERLPGQPALHPKPVRPTSVLQTGERLVAAANAPGATGTIGYNVDDALRHTWVMGPSGVGKSSLFLNLIINDMKAGRPLVVIEPKDLVADILKHIPKKRRQDVAVLDPLDTAPIGINPLDGKHRGGRSPQVVADSLFGMFTSIYGDLGNRSADILRNCLYALALRDDASLMMLPLMLTNPGFRRSLTQRAVREDPYAAGWFWERFDSLSPDAAASIIAPLSNKLRPLPSKQLRAVLAQRNPKFNIRQVLTERKILLVPLQKGVIGPESAQLLSAVVLYELWASILERAATPEESRDPLMVYVDEVQEFLRFGGDLADALALARSLKAGFHLAHQHRAQLPKPMLEAFKNNARSKVLFQLEADDAKEAAAGQSALKAEDFSAQPAFHVYASLIRDNSSQPWVSGLTIEPPKKPSSDPEEIRRLSRERYGQPLDEIEAGFAELLDPPSDKTTTRRKRRQA